MKNNAFKIKRVTEFKPCGAFNLKEQDFNSVKKVQNAGKQAILIRRAILSLLKEFASKTLVDCEIRAFALNKIITAEAILPKIFNTNSL